MNNMYNSVFWIRNTEFSSGISLWIYGSTKNGFGVRQILILQYRILCSYTLLFQNTATKYTLFHYRKSIKPKHTKITFLIDVMKGVLISDHWKVHLKKKIQNPNFKIIFLNFLLCIGIYMYIYCIPTGSKYFTNSIQMIGGVLLWERAQRGERAFLLMNDRICLNSRKICIGIHSSSLRAVIHGTC